MDFGNGITMTDSQYAAYRQRQQAIQDAIRGGSLASGIAALGGAIGSRMGGGDAASAGPGMFPAAPPAPGGQPTPTSLKSSAPAQPAMVRNFYGGQPTGGPMMQPPGHNVRGEPVGPDVGRKDSRTIIAALAGRLP